MLEYSFGLTEEAAAITGAIEAVLNFRSSVTADLHPAGRPATRPKVGEAVCAGDRDEKESRE